MNFTLDDDDMTQLDFADMRMHSHNFAIQSLQGMGKLEKRPSTSDPETEDSGFGSNLSPPFAKAIKLDEESSTSAAGSWPFGFMDRRAAFAPASNENCNKCADNGRFYHFSGKYSSRSRDGRAELKILSQPEEQHRARYMTEGSRGAIKDRSGLGHPCIKLTGVNVPVRVDCFIGHDKHLGLPHLFYQASRINGKNATRCVSTKIEGTTVISFDLLPETNMHAMVDCVGILKERNVDVEHKLQRLKNKGELFNMTKKRSTRCRIVFRCELPDTKEILMAVTGPILCTQPAGCPEIAKKSVVECDVGGGVELFMIGKNFVKDSKVVWKGSDWMKVVEPNKEFLHSTHILCTIPPYDGPKGQGNVAVSLFVKNSDGKSSESHAFLYTRRSSIAAPAATNDSLSTGHYRSDYLVPTKCMQSVAMAPEFGASKSDTLMNGHHMSAPSKQLQLQNFALSSDGSHADLPLDGLFTQANGTADFQSFTPATDAGSGGMGYSQATRVADCSFPDNVSNNTFPAPLPDVSECQSQCTRSAVSQPDFLNHNSLAHSAGPIPSSHQTMSINAMSQMTENELLWVINPSTFEPCV